MYKCQNFTKDKTERNICREEKKMAKMKILYILHGKSGYPFDFQSLDGTGSTTGNMFNIDTTLS